jgi:hypothetical protein
MLSIEDEPSQLIYKLAAVIVHRKQCSVLDKSSPLI